MSMTVSNTYSQHTNTKKDISRYRTKRLLLLCSILLFGIPAIAQNHPPSFVNGISQVFNGCENITGPTAAGTSINTILAATDLDLGQEETWTIAVTPFHGILNGFPTTDTSTGGIVTPAGLTYTPDSGYIGTDSFTIEVTDGTDIAFTTVVVNVNTLPHLSSSLAPPAICDNTTFYYSPTSATGGATFTWHRASALNVLPASSESGVGNVNEVLGNTTFYNVATTYVYTVMANGCTGIPQHVVATIKPTPLLSSPAYDTVCSGGVVNYIPSSLTSGTSYTWSRAGVAGISPDTSVGTGNINEALINSLSSPVTTVYNFALLANGCTSAASVHVTINPQPSTPITSITTAPSSSICAGTSFQNFGASIPPPSGITYSWSVTNGNIYSISGNGQFILVDFPNAGDAVVTLSYADAGAQCVINETATVIVGAATAPSGYILYNNYQFIYMDNTADSYQWGYDNTTTLDSTLIPGATFQSYVNAAPDYIDNYYWVLTTKSGCMQKTYFNAPSAIKNINSNVTIKVYPKPANNIVTIDLGNAQRGVTTIAVANMLGQNIKTQTITALTAQLDVATLPAGCYVVSCLQDGVKIATASFIKN